MDDHGTSLNSFCMENIGALRPPLILTVSGAPPSEYPSSSQMYKRPPKGVAACMPTISVAGDVETNAWRDEIEIIIDLAVYSLSCRLVQRPLASNLGRQQYVDVFGVDSCHRGHPQSSRHLCETRSEPSISSLDASVPLDLEAKIARRRGFSNPLPLRVTVTTSPGGT